MTESEDGMKDEVITKMLDAWFGAGIHSADTFGPYRKSDIQAARRAYEAVRPLVLAEALAEPRQHECEAAKFSHTSSTAFAVEVFLTNRLTRLTAKPDPAVEAVKVQLKRIVFGDHPPPQAEEYAAQIVAAVDKARA